MTDTAVTDLAVQGLADAPEWPDIQAERRVDVLVVGAGAAGLSVALGLAGLRSVLVLSSAAGPGGSTAWAQGGIAAAVRDTDSPAAHAADTAVAGAGLCDPGSTRILVEEGPSALADLIRAGAVLDRDGTVLSLTREGGHDRDRVAHAGGDATGAEVSRALAATLDARTISLDSGSRVLDLLVSRTGGRPRVCGAVVASATANFVVHARAVVLATGGLGHLYAGTTNPPEVDGSGLALALRAGAELVDLEFVQFHPTVLVDATHPNGQQALVSEAVRGEGGVLLDHTGRAFMRGLHPLADLAPRDVVARAITRAIAERPAGTPAQVRLDTTRLGRAHLARRFPTLLASCARLGIDPAREPVPVAPREHFSCGGVRTDTWGRTGVDGLFAVGEVAATGVHGANRLASNAMLEGLVFGRRVATRLALDLPMQWATPDAPVRGPRVVDTAAAGIVPGLLESGAGVLRDGPGLAAAARMLAGQVRPAGPSGSKGSMTPRAGDRPQAGPDVRAQTAPDDAARAAWVAHAVASVLVAGALARTESRGCHSRTDHPDTAPVAHRLSWHLDESGTLVARRQPRDSGDPTTGGQRRTEPAATKVAA